MGVLSLSLVGIPGAPDARLDASWQQMLIHAHVQGLQFGRDVIFTWGPWGFLCNGYHMGSAAAWPILAWETLGQLGIACALWVLTRGVSPGRRWVFLGVFLAFHWLFLDTEYFVLVLLVGISGLLRRETTLLSLVAWAALLGFLAQLKFTYFAISAAAVAAGVACAWGWGRPGRAAALAGAFGASVGLFWAAAGQNLDNLYPYLRRSADIASGYGDAMGLDETWPQFLWGAALAVLCLAYLWSLWRGMDDRVRAGCTAAFVGFCLLAMWKESYTRADMVPLGGHLFGLVTLVAILSPVVGPLVSPLRRFQASDLALPFCLVAVFSFDRPFYALAPRIEWQRLYGSGYALGHLSALPDAWQRDYERSREANALPEVRVVAGQQPLDVYNFNTGVALLNDLNLDARPIFQSYSAYTPSLEGWNLRFYQSPRAPAYLLWSGERIDRRYPGQDDAMLLAALPGHYEPLFLEGGYWLLHRTSALASAPGRRRLLLDRTVHLSEEIAVPGPHDHALWLEVDARANALGRARALLYKPATLMLGTVDDQGNAEAWRLLPRVASAGFLLAPKLETGEAMASFLRGEAATWTTAFRFEAPESQAEFWSRFDVRLWELTDLPLRASVPLERLVALGIVDRPALWVTSEEGQSVFDRPEGHALLLHPSGEIALPVPAGGRWLTGAFGLREGAYLSGGEFMREGHTKGVAFSVEAAWPSGRREQIWSRYLDPAHARGDRGPQALRVALPAETPSRLVLRTAPGPDGDKRWCWSYVMNLRVVSP